jgi:hypothetical protein
MSYAKNNEKIDKRTFYKEKILLFRGYAEKHPERDLLELYNEWIAEDNIYGIDRHKIWQRARKLRQMEPIIIKEGSEESIRLQAVLDILLEADLKYLHELVEKKYGKKQAATL